MEYLIESAMAIVEQDSFNEGCIGIEIEHLEIDQFELGRIGKCDKVLSKIIANIMKHYELSIDALEMNSCEELGRLDFSLHSLSNCALMQPSDREIELTQRT